LIARAGALDEQLVFLLFRRAAWTRRYYLHFFRLGIRASRSRRLSL
jgi:hypothetical protein